MQSIALSGTWASSLDQARTGGANKGQCISPRRAGATAIEHPPPGRRDLIHAHGLENLADTSPDTPQSTGSVHELYNLWARRLASSSLAPSNVSQRRCCGPGSSALLCVRHHSLWLRGKSMTCRQVYLDRPIISSRQIADVIRTSKT
ncbi:hypothetical protein J3F83DRAFT_105443 [Trichoderma novae-zelandiae]